MSILVAFSANLYGALVWGGSLPYFINQLFLPLITFLLIKYLNTSNKRWFWFAAALLGYAFLGHMANTGAYTFPFAIILIFFGKRRINVSKITKIKEATLTYIISYLIAYRMLVGSFLNYFISILDYVLPPTCDGSLSSSSKCRRSELALTESNYEITSYAYLKLSYDMYFLNFGGGVFYENIEEDSEYENLRYHISSSKDLSDYWYTRLGFQW